MPETLTPNPAEIKMPLPVQQEAAPAAPAAPEAVGNQAQLESYAQMSAAATTEGDKKFWNDKFVAAGGTMGSEAGGVEIGTPKKETAEPKIGLDTIGQGIKALMDKGAGLEDPTVKFFLDKVPEADRGAFLEILKADSAAREAEPVKPVAAEVAGKVETAEAAGPQTITLESGVVVNVGDLVQVEDIKGSPVQVRIRSFDDKGGSVQVEDLDATGKSSGGRGGNVEFILKGAKVIKA